MSAEPGRGPVGSGLVGLVWPDRPDSNRPSMLTEPGGPNAAILSPMEEALLDIIASIKAASVSDTRPLDGAWLDKLVRRHNRAAHDGTRTVAKRRLLPYYLQVRAHDPERWRSWEVDEATEIKLLRLLKMKPRRTASGVATVTVITKPWPCSSDCLYCPCDVRMPKSYLAAEPACQRAEHNYFDPYLQVKSRLHVLSQMGHVTDKVELIVLGGTWNDYPEEYQRWFVRELFRAANDGLPYLGGPELPQASASEEAPHAANDRQPFPKGPELPQSLASSEASRTGSAESAATRDHDARARASFYAACGISSETAELATAAAEDQRLVNEGRLSYNAVVLDRLAHGPWQEAARIQHASWKEVEAEHRANETARHRVVGLVIETRPDLITPTSARTMRRLGCTKVQMGIQSLDDAVLAANRRHVSSDQIARAFAVLRSYGFKLHVHFMANLLGSSPATDRVDYQRLVDDPRFRPDEVKLYPCALVESSRLMDAYEAGRWQPYPEDELVGLLVNDVLATPAYVRISRMIRDISATDIVAGNKKTNLRQMVEDRLADRRDEVREIRMREVSTDDVSPEQLVLDCVRYRTATSDERFLQWVDPAGRIAGFCRLSLPDEDATRPSFGDSPLPTAAGTAMIREVHVYGRVASLGASEQGAAQHAGLGRALVEEACRQAREAGYSRIAVISAIGTRSYYRSLGFADAGLYQLRDLSRDTAEHRAGASPSQGFPIE